jgi:hypothetical protein
MNEGFGVCTPFDQSVKAMLTTQMVNFCLGVNDTLDYLQKVTPFVVALLTEVQS